MGVPLCFGTKEIYKNAYYDHMFIHALHGVYKLKEGRYQFISHRPQYKLFG